MCVKILLSFASLQNYDSQTLDYTGSRRMSNLFGKLGIILHESSLPWLECSYTCSDLMDKKKIMKQWEADRIRPIFHTAAINTLMSFLQGEPLLTGLKITSSSRVMLPFDSPPKSSFFSGKAICCPLRICRTERALGAVLGHEPDHQSCWITSQQALNPLECYRPLHFNLNTECK